MSLLNFVQNSMLMTKKLLGCAIICSSCSPSESLKKTNVGNYLMLTNQESFSCHYRPVFLRTTTDPGQRNLYKVMKKC